MARQPPARRYSRKPPRRRQSPRLWGKDTLTIERMSQEGRGVARRDGKIVFVSGALEGEQVRVQCTAVKKDFDEAELIELLADSAPAADRVPPPCPIYHECGGCSLQHWSLAAQQRHKQATLAAMLQALSPVELETPILSQPRGFRHRLRLLVTRGADNSYALCLRQSRSNEPVNVQHCLVANAAVNAMLQRLPGMLNSVPDLQGLREIDIDADSNEQIGLCFYFAANPGERQLAALRAAVLRDPVIALRARLNTQRRPRKDSLLDEVDAQQPNQWQELLAEGELCLQPRLHADNPESPLADLALAYLPGDFTQTHWAVNAALVARALDWLQPTADEHALDLFAGVGNFSLPLARSAESVQAFESDSAMTLRLTANAAHNNIENLRASTLDLLTDTVVLPTADIAIVDPPRAGAKAVCEALASARVKRLVYVSCHPATLARDARILLAAGYRLRKAAAVDMFPHTGHSEAMVLFERK